MTLLIRVGSVLAVSAVVLVSTGAAMPAAGQAGGRASGHHGTRGSASWRLSPTGSTARLRGLSAVSADVAWASGTAGTVLRTTDSGATWSSVGPRDTPTLQFRDIEATSASHAVALSIGEGEDSRVYVTDDGGATWAESFRNHEAAAFYDCMAFFNDKDGLALSDPVDGKFRLIRTSDAGHSWSIVDNVGMPSARTAEFAFAASGTCLTTGPGHRAYIGSGGSTPDASTQRRTPARRGMFRTALLRAPRRAASSRSGSETADEALPWVETSPIRLATLTMPPSLTTVE